MKVYIGPYRSRWISNIHTNYMHWKYGRFKWDDNTTRFEHALEKFEDALQWLYNETINKILDERSSQKMKIRIDKYDTWSMDHTLAPIILPMLKQLKATKHGSPMVDMIDVPQELRINDVESKEFWDSGEVDDKHQDRWEWMLDEMIWAFEQKTYDWESQYYGEWVKDESEDNLFGGRFINSNDEGRKAHQERMSNGFRLFGKYYEALWD